MCYMSKGTRNIIFYLSMIVVFGTLMYFITKAGENHQIGSVIQTNHDAPTTLSEGFEVFRHLVVEHIKSSLGILLLQIIIILLACRLFGWFFLKLGQPTVIGEIVAGIVLGPSVLGNLFPEISAFIFPSLD